MKRALLVAVVVVLGGWITAYIYRDDVRQWFAPRQELSIFVSGNIEAHQSVLAFKGVQSQLVELPFNEGQWVKAGTVLARLDSEDYCQQVAVAEATLEVQRRQLAAAEQNLEAVGKTVESDAADLEFRKTQYERAQTLLQKAAGTVEQRDQAYTAMRQSGANHERDQALQRVAQRQVELAHANVDNARESLKLAQIVLEHTVLRAPFDGVVTVRQAELGEVMVPGTPVVTLADLDHVWLRAYINETDIGKVRLDQAAAITTDTYPHKVYHGRVSFISSNAEFTPKSVETHAERVTLVYRIKIDIENKSHELVPGMPADATLQALPAAQS